MSSAQLKMSRLVKEQKKKNTCIERKRPKDNEKEIAPTVDLRHADVPAVLKKFGLLMGMQDLMFEEMKETIRNDLKKMFEKSTMPKVKNRKKCQEVKDLASPKPKLVKEVEENPKENEDIEHLSLKRKERTKLSRKLNKAKEYGSDPCEKSSVGGSQNHKVIENMGEALCGIDDRCRNSNSRLEVLERQKRKNGEDELAKEITRGKNQQKSKYKENFQSTFREENLMKEGAVLRLAADFSSATLDVKKQWSNIFNILRENGLEPELLCKVKLAFKCDGQVNTFSSLQSLRKFASQKPLMKKLLKDVLPQCEVNHGRKNRIQENVGKTLIDSACKGGGTCDDLSFLFVNEVKIAKSGKKILGDQGAEASPCKEKETPKFVKGKVLEPEEECSETEEEKEEETSEMEEEEGEDTSETEDEGEDTSETEEEKGEETSETEEEEGEETSETEEEEGEDTSETEEEEEDISEKVKGEETSKVEGEETSESEEEEGEETSETEEEGEDISETEEQEGKETLEKVEGEETSDLEEGEESSEMREVRKQVSKVEGEAKETSDMGEDGEEASLLHEKQNSTFRVLNVEDTQCGAEMVRDGLEISLISLVVESESKEKEDRTVKTTSQTEKKETLYDLKDIALSYLVWDSEKKRLVKSQEVYKAQEETAVPRNQGTRTPCLTLYVAPPSKSLEISHGDPQKSLCTNGSFLSSVPLLLKNTEKERHKTVETAKETELVWATTEENFRRDVIRIFREMQEDIGNLKRSYTDVIGMKDSVDDLSSLANMLEEKVNNLDDEMNELTKHMINKERMRKEEDKLRSCNIRLIGIPEKNDKDNRAEDIMKEVIEENFPELKGSYFDIISAHRIPSSIDENRPTPRHILVRFGNYSDKQKVLRASREKKEITYRGMKVRMTADLSPDTIDAGRQWTSIVKVLQEEGFEPRILYPAKLVFSFEGKTKVFFDIEEFKKFISCVPYLKRIVGRSTLEI